MTSKAPAPDDTEAVGSCAFVSVIRTFTTAWLSGSV